MESFASAFPGLKLTPTEEIEEEIQEDITYLWTTNYPVFEIYQIAKNYMTEYYGLDSLILVELIREQSLPLTRMLFLIPFIHSGFLSIVVPKPEEKDNGREQNFN